MEKNIAVITVPLDEWTEVKTQLNTISKTLMEMNGNAKSEFLTPKEVCELLKCSRNTFQSYIDKGLLTPIKMKTESVGFGVGISYGINTLRRNYSPGSLLNQRETNHIVGLGFFKRKWHSYATSLSTHS